MLPEIVLKNNENFKEILDLRPRKNEKIIKEFEYEHPIFFPGIIEYQAQHKSLIRNNKLSFCGAYWGYGFHEDGVDSAIRVCESYDLGLV